MSRTCYNYLTILFHGVIGHADFLYRGGDSDCRWSAARRLARMAHLWLYGL